jgi:hypothetical protein
MSSRTPGAKKKEECDETGRAAASVAYPAFATSELTALLHFHVLHGHVS